MLVHSRDRPSRRTDLALCGIALVILSPLLWTLGRIVRDVIMDMPTEQPWVLPDTQ
jgi:hypothetical protein